MSRDEEERKKRRKREDARSVLRDDNRKIRATHLPGAVRVYPRIIRRIRSRIRTKDSRRRGPAARATVLNSDDRYMRVFTSLRIVKETELKSASGIGAIAVGGTG